MVINNKQIRVYAKGKTSGLAKKRIKSQYKGHKKDNYKKKKVNINNNKTEEVQLIECNICYNIVEDTLDNSIMCGPKKHIICSDCKLRIASSPCPMCRSHTIRPPIVRDYNLPICHKVKKGKSPCISDISRMSPKNIRNTRRSGPHIKSFSNRLTQQRRLHHMGGVAYPFINIWQSQYITNNRMMIMF